jgi:hypothetical protein
MKTTITLAEGQREKLQELAASRGDRGCSKIVQEAVARYLDELTRPRPEPLRAEVMAAPAEARPRDVVLALVDLATAAWQLAHARAEVVSRVIRARLSRFAA